MGVLLFLLVAYLLLCYGLSLVFAKAADRGAPVKAAEAWIPGVNFARWCTLIGRRPAFALWLLAPLVNVFVYAGMCVDLARSFGRHSFGHAALAVAGAPLYFVWLGRSPGDAYEGPVLEAERAYAAAIAEADARGEARKAERLRGENPYRRSGGREWAEAIIFAVAAAALIRLFVFEMYTIPTSSMEGSMLVGDYLLVSKAHYGVRTPQTIAMVPLLHNRLPGNAGESYSEWPSLRMRRLPALESVDRNDPIVFNFPLGDSVYVMPGRTWSAEDVRFGNAQPDHARRILAGKEPLVTRPIDKKDHYVKRAVAVAGDTVEIRDRDLYIDGERAVDPPNIQFSYVVANPDGVAIDFARVEEWGISAEDLLARGPRDAAVQLARPQFYAVLSEEQAARLRDLGPGITVEPLVDAPPSRDTTARANPNRNPYKLFPHDPANFGDWTKDNFGPVWVPAAGATVAIGPRNIALYRRAIEVYEGHEVDVRDGAVYIDGERATEYTFEQDYYWAMGDNRHSSEDSRFWGFVPADHIVGKPLFIWFSTKNADIKQGIRWDRIFSGATQMD